MLINGNSLVSTYASSYLHMLRSNYHCILNITDDHELSHMVLLLDMTNTFTYHSNTVKD